MPIKRVETKALKKFKPGWREDKAKGVWYTYELDYIEPGTGMRKRRRGFHSKDEAERFVRQQIAGVEIRRLGLAAPEERQWPELREIFQKRLPDIATKRERVRSQRVFRQFLALLPEGFPVQHLKTRHFKMFADSRLRQKVKAETVNRELTAVRSALSFAHLNFPQLEDWTPPKGYRAPVTERSRRERVITPREEAKILKHLRRRRTDVERDFEYDARIRTALVFEFALATGMRHAEICALKKSDCKRNEFSVWRGKTKQWVTFPMTDRIREMVKEGSKLFEGEFVFSTKGIPQGRTWRILRDACSDVGIDYGRGAGMVLHTARHTFITRMLQAGVDIATIQSFTSHSDRSMVMHYSHATEATRKKALAKVTKSEPDGDEDLKNTWEKVRAGKMSFAAFKRKLER